MKMQVKEFSGLTGVSIRTLHYYDEIGLLAPSSVDDRNGYRYYDNDSLLRMQEILFYRELDFSLSSIKKILSSPDYDKKSALKEQKRLLIIKKERIERIIFAIEGAEKGENIMSAFDNSELKKQKDEVKEKWGKTEAYREYSEKTKNYSAEKWSSVSDGLNFVFSEFADCMKSGESEDSSKAQDLVKKLQNFINENYYNCTEEILFGLGQMYVLDERFRNNIDKNGSGTAEFVSNAIAVYCKK